MNYTMLLVVCLMVTTYAVTDRDRQWMLWVSMPGALLFAALIAINLFFGV
jgi:hypothetical protein